MQPLQHVALLYLCQVSSITPDEKNFFCVGFQPPSLSSTDQTLRTLGIFRVDSCGSDTLQQTGLKQVGVFLLELPSAWSATQSDAMLMVKIKRVKLWVGHQPLD